ncbi:MAG: hypothetical protein RIR83_909, partial [Pseudomonadota bacterium]
RVVLLRELGVHQLDIAKRLRFGLEQGGRLLTERVDLHHAPTVRLIKRVMRASSNDLYRRRL